MAAGAPPTVGAFSLSVMILGLAAAWLQCVLGARKAHTPYSATDMILAPLYWSMLSLAFAHAAWRLIREPYAWDKTPHQRDPIQVEDTDAGLAAPETDPARAPQTGDRTQPRVRLESIFKF